MHPISIGIVAAQIGCNRETIRFMKKRGGYRSRNEYRPFVCRKHVTLAQTSFWCEPSRCNEHEFTLCRFSNVDKSFAYKGWEANGDAVIDIREVFTVEDNNI